MNLKALITTAILVGTSTAALAAPRQSGEVRDHRTTTVAMRGEISARFDSNDRVRDHRGMPVTSYQPPALAPVYGNELFTVASFNHAFDGIKTVDLGCEGQAVSKLRIVSNDLASEVYNVTLHFSDGHSYTYSENHIFGAAQDGQLGHNLDFNFVAGTRLSSIDVSARNASNSNFRVEIA